VGKTIDPTWHGSKKDGTESLASRKPFGIGEQQSQYFTEIGRRVWKTGPRLVSPGGSFRRASVTDVAWRGRSSRLDDGRPHLCNVRLRLSV